MNEQQCKDLYRQVLAARVEMVAGAPLTVDELEVLKHALKLEASLILLLATKPNYFAGAL